MGFISELHVEIRDNDTVREVVTDPNEEDIEAALERMDQHHCSAVTMRGQDWWFMAIGGGLDAFVVMIENQMSGKRFQLLRPGAVGKVEVVTGGQRGRIPAEFVVCLEHARLAALTFLRNGRPDERLTWRADVSP